MKDLVHKEPNRSTPKWIALPGSLAPPSGKAVQGHAGLYCVAGWGNAYQQALFLRLLATIRRPVQGVA
jgi:hypothetical protein